jgi:hypothetical protein
MGASWLGALVCANYITVNFARIKQMWPKLQVIRYYRRYTLRAPFATLRYMLFERESTNFTYEIANEKQLGEFLIDAFAAEEGDPRRYIDELQSDQELRDALQTRLRRRRDRNRIARYGRRVGWYAITRLVKPALIVETGIHDGLGSAVLLRALQRNAEEGHEGRLLSIDIDPGCGWLVPIAIAERWTPIIGDAKAALGKHLQGRQVDFFIHDSDHTYDHEKFEFQTAIQHATPSSVMLSDNSHSSDVLKELSTQWGRRFLFFGEQPMDHFYPGGGIGLSLPRA